MSCGDHPIDNEIPRISLEEDTICKGGDEEAYAEFERFDFEHSQSFQVGWSTLSKVVDPEKIGIEYMKAKVFYFSKYHTPINLEKYLSWKKAQSDGRNRITQKDAARGTQQPMAESDKGAGIDRDIGSSTTSPVCQNKDVCESNEVRDCAITHPTNDTSSSKVCACDDITSSLRSASLDRTTKTNGAETDIVRVNRSEESVSSLETEKDKCDNIPASENITRDDEDSSLSLLEVASYIQNGLPIPGLVSLEVKPTNESPTPSSRERKLKPWETRVKESAELCQ